MDGLYLSKVLLNLFRTRAFFTTQLLHRLYSSRDHKNGIRHTKLTTVYLPWQLNLQIVSYLELGYIAEY